MAKREVVWTATAARQLQFVIDYWNEHNGSTAYSTKLYAQIRKRTEVLIQFPKAGRSTEIKNTLITSLGHYSLIYQANKTQIVITGFWDNRQDPNKLLDFLKA